MCNQTGRSDKAAKESEPIGRMLNKTLQTWLNYMTINSSSPTKQVINWLDKILKANREILLESLERQGSTGSSFTDGLSPCTGCFLCGLPDHDNLIGYPLLAAYSRNSRKVSLTVRCTPFICATFIAKLRPKYTYRIFCSDQGFILSPKLLITYEFFFVPFIFT